MPSNVCDAVCVDVTSAITYVTTCARTYKCTYAYAHTCIHVPHTRLTHPQTNRSSSAFDVSLATKLSGSLGTPDLPAVNLDALLACRNVKPSPAVAAITVAVREI